MNVGYERIAKRELYRNPWLGFEVHEIRHPNGVLGEHGLVDTPVASGVVIVDEDDLLFTRQARFGARTDVLEIVKGGADADESALECAQRETREELGIVAERWEPMGLLYEIPSLMSNPLNLFLATQVYHVDTEFEPVETIELVRVPRKIAFAAVASGEINDGITTGALLRYGLLSGYLSISH
jgi:8-oxo-dGTP pyrophosphatase MutT (NUDIX family)